MIPKLFKVISGKYVDDTLNYLLSHQGGGASVNTFTQDIILTGNTIPLDTGFYNTGNYGLFVGSQTPQNIIFGAEEIIYVDTSTLTIVGSLVSIAYNLIDSVWTIQDNQKIENEVTNNRDKIPTSQAVFNGLAGKQNTLTAGQGISIVNNVISATGGGGGVSVTNLTQNVILGAGSSTTGLSTGFYNTNGYGVYYHSATLGNLIYGNGIFYYDDTELTFIDSYNITNYSVGDTDWIVTNNASVESTLTNSKIHVPNSYAVSQALGEKLENNTTGTTSSVTSIWTGTQTEYDLLATHSSTTLYFIKE